MIRIDRGFSFNTQRRGECATSHLLDVQRRHAGSEKIKANKALNRYPEVAFSCDFETWEKIAIHHAGKT
jgi:hypothetical protein